MQQLGLSSLGDCRNILSITTSSHLTCICMLFFRYRQPPLDYDLIQYTQYDKLEVFDKVATWDFPIFELEDKASDHILSHVSVPFSYYI